MGILTDFHELWIRKIQRNLRDHGLFTVIRKSIAYAVRPFYEDRVYRLYKINLSRTLTESPSDIDGVEFRMLASQDLDAISQVEACSEWLRGSLEERLRAGALCLAAFENSQLVGFNLISFRNVYMPLISLHRLFRDDEAWSEQITVVKHFRKKGLGASLRYRIFLELRNRGFRKLYGGALADNIPSFKLAQRVGFREFVDVRYSRFLNSRNWQYTRVRP